jgi:hypothetical protein
MKNSPTAKAPAVPPNPLVGDNVVDTIDRVRSVGAFLQLTVPSLATNGSSKSATDGLTLVMQMLVEGLEAAEAQLEQRGAP